MKELRLREEWRLTHRARVDQHRCVSQCENLSLKQVQEHHSLHETGEGCKDKIEGPKYCCSDSGSLLVLTITQPLSLYLSLFTLFPGSTLPRYIDSTTNKGSLQLLNSSLKNLRQILMSGKGLVKWGPDKFVFRTKCKLRWKLRMRILGHIEGGSSQVSLHLYGGLGQATKM